MTWRSARIPASSPIRITTSSGRKVTEERIQRDIDIGSNVFVGAHCTILPGTQVADDVIIGAGSVVKGVLEGNSIYAGVPCKKLRSGWYA